MIIGYFNISRAVLCPLETDAVLIVDADAMLSLPISGQQLQPVAGRHPQILKRSRRIKLIELPACNSPEVFRANFPRRFG
jgi:hypothetical protein